MNLTREEMARIPLVWVKNANGVGVRVRNPRRVRWAIMAKEAQKTQGNIPEARWQSIAEQYRHAVLLQRVPVAPIRSQAVPMAPSERITASDIIHETCEQHGLLKQDVIGGSRQRHIVKARQECMYRLSTEMGMSLPQIARILGRRDHTTILHGIRAHAATLSPQQAAA